MTAREADTAILKHTHEALKAARAVTDDGLRARLLEHIEAVDRLHGISLSARHDEEVYRREVEAQLKKQ